MGLDANAPKLEYLRRFFLEAQCMELELCVVRPGGLEARRRF